MKKALSLILSLLLCLSLLPHVSIAAGATDDVYLFTGLSSGNTVDFAHIDGWTVMNGFLDGEFCIIGEPDGGGGRVVLVGGDPLGFVPCGDKIGYYGLDSQGKWKWQVLKPGGKPVTLPLTMADDLLWGNSEEIWYTSPASGGQSTIYSIDHNGENKKRVMNVHGNVLAVMDDGTVVTVDFEKNTLLQWKDGKYTTIFRPREKMLSVSTTGIHLWVMFSGYFQLIDGGETVLGLPGDPLAFAFSGQEAIMLVDESGRRKQYAVYVMLDSHSRYIELEGIPYATDYRIEMQSDGGFYIRNDQWTHYFRMTLDTPFWSYFSGDDSEGDGEWYGDDHFEEGDGEWYDDSEYYGEGDGQWEEDDHSDEVDGQWIDDDEAAIPPPTDEEWMGLLIGSWTASEPMGRGRGRIAIFREDHTALLLPDDEEEDDYPLVTPWEVQNGQLVIYLEGLSGRTPFHIPLTLVSSLETDDPDEMFEIYLGNTLMLQYMEQPDSSFDFDEYLYGD